MGAAEDEPRRGLDPLKGPSDSCGSSPVAVAVFIVLTHARFRSHAVATYPLDLVRARLSIATANLSQTGGGPSAFTAEDAKLGISGMTKKVYHTEGGLRGLYRGCWATAVGVAPYGEYRCTGQGRQRAPRPL